MSLYELVSLEADISARLVGEFFKKEGYDIRRSDLTDLCMRGTKATIRQLIDHELPADNKKRIVVYGSGAYHHYTYGLYLNATRKLSKHGYIHFDHHADYRCTFFAYPESLNCGAFVKEMLKDSGASGALFIGSIPPAEKRPGCPLGFQHPSISEDQLRKRKRFLKSGAKYDLLDLYLSELPGNVYLSFDLDVLAPSEILTDYSRGTMKTEELIGIIEVIKTKKHIISADVLGFSGIRMHKKSANAYRRIVDTLLKP